MFGIRSTANVLNNSHVIDIANVVWPSKYGFSFPDMCGLEHESTRYMMCYILGCWHLSKAQVGKDYNDFKTLELKVTKGSTFANSEQK